MYLDDINEGPPRLVEEGFRVQADWFYHFLTNPEIQKIRPWLSVSMPTFNLSTQEKNTLINGFQQGAKQPTFVETSEFVKWAPGEREETVKLYNALNCIQCHSQGVNNETPLAPDLRKASKRLRPTWIAKWISNPQAIMPGTTMPNFFGDDGKEPIEAGYFGGDADKQINALTNYIIEMGAK